MSYNILADRLVDLPKFVKYTTPATRDFTFRSRRIVGELKNSNSDLICLQEVDQYDEFYSEQLKDMGYEVIFRPKQTLEVAQQHGVAIGWKENKFTKIGERWVELNQMFTEFIADDVLRRDNHAVFVLLKHIPSGKYLIVGNTHLFHNPAFDFVKHAQAVYLLMQATAFHNDALQQLALIDDEFARHDCKTLPFVLAGDFNSQPVSSVMSAIHGEELDSSSWEEDYMSDPLKREFYLKSDQILKDWRKQASCLQFNSAYNLYNQLWPLETAYFVSFEGIKQAIAQQDSYKNARAKLQPLYTNYTETFKGTLDHLLHNECLLPLELLEIPEGMKLKKEVALPSTLFPSDHVRIEATFVIM